jgi:hypothetical protein
VRLPFKEYQRRSLVPLLGLALGAYYFFFLMPLARQAKSLDEPLQKARLKLLASLDQTNALAIDFQRITNQLSETQQALQILEKAKDRAKARLQLGAAVRTKMFSDFELVDYDTERSKQLEELGNLAKQQQTVVDPSVFTNFPVHTVDVKQPALLWAALSLTEHLIRTAIQCKVTGIQSLEVLPVLTNAPPTSSTSEPLAQMPLQVEFTASAATAARLLQCLPLRAEEVRAAGLPEAAADKPALFVDRLIVQKQSPDKPDEVHVWLRAVGFVLRE